MKNFNFLQTPVWFLVYSPHQHIPAFICGSRSSVLIISSYRKVLKNTPEPLFLSAIGGQLGSNGSDIGLSEVMSAILSTVLYFIFLSFLDRTLNISPKKIRLSYPENLYQAFNKGSLNVFCSPIGVACVISSSHSFSSTALHFRCSNRSQTSKYSNSSPLVSVLKLS